MSALGGCSSQLPLTTVSRAGGWKQPTAGVSQTHEVTGGQTPDSRTVAGSSGMDDCRVIDLVRHDDINIVGQNSSLRQAAERFLLSDCELLAVTDEQGKLAGIVSESSVVRGLLNSASGEMHLSLLTSHHAESIRSDLPVTQVLHLFRSSCHSAIPVVDQDDCVCGLLRRRDVMQFLLSGRVDTAHTRTAD
jgi:CBS-domain-containing membrane protein